MDERTLAALLASSNAEDLRRGVDLVRTEIARKGSDSARPLFEMLSSLFFIDPLDRPDLVPILNDALDLMVGFGTWVIPSLLRQLDAGDLKAQMAAAHALGRMGADAIEPLIAESESASDPARRSFALYALGKVRSPNVARVLPLALGAADSPVLELRDTAVRTIGKLVESIRPSELPENIRKLLSAVLRKNLADPNAGIRAKAVRSLGKLVRYGFVDPGEREKLKTTFLLIAGRDDHFAWDHAYIVRKEAEGALQHCLTTEDIAHQGS